MTRPQLVPPRLLSASMETSLNLAPALLFAPLFHPHASYSLASHEARRAGSALPRRGRGTTWVRYSDAARGAGARPGWWRYPPRIRAVGPAWAAGSGCWGVRGSARLLRASPRVGAAAGDRLARGRSNVPASPRPGRGSLRPYTAPRTPGWAGRDGTRACRGRRDSL